MKTTLKITVRQSTDVDGNVFFYYQWAGNNLCRAVIYQDEIISDFYARTEFFELFNIDWKKAFN